MTPRWGHETATIVSDHHDSLFKSVFEHPQNAARYFKAVLPPNLVSRLDVDQASLQSGHFCNEALKNLYTDLLFQVPYRTAEGDDTKAGVYLYILFEHQSTYYRHSVKSHLTH